VGALAYLYKHVTQRLETGTHIITKECPQLLSSSVGTVNKQTQ